MGVVGRFTYADGYKKRIRQLKSGEWRGYVGNECWFTQMTEAEARKWLTT